MFIDEPHNKGLGGESFDCAALYSKQFDRFIVIKSSSQPPA
jgi:hypothetical protein